MEKLNIAEILRHCPKGTKLYTTVWGDVEFIKLCDVGMITVLPISNPCNTINTKLLYSDGRFTLDGECILFPSKDNRDWTKFQRPFKDGDIITCTNRACTFVAIYKRMCDKYSFYRYVCLILNERMQFSPDSTSSDFTNPRFATEEEKQKLFDAIKANGYKWNAETKTLEKLPKFKVGDRIKHRLTGDVFKVLFVLSNGYGGGVYDVAITNEIGKSIDIEEQDSYELVPNKFDITTLKPFSKVLVRQNVYGKWEIDFFGYYNKGDHHTTGSCIYKQCVPYESNEHLLGTTNDCDDYYKTWE